jgi:hypothetical protein
MTVTGSLLLFPVIGVEDSIEKILFLVAFAVFGLIRFIASKSGDDEDKPDNRQARQEQQRRTSEVQEEIRRRIMESMAERAAMEGRPMPQPQAPVQPVRPAEIQRSEPVFKKAEIHMETRAQVLQRADANAEDERRRNATRKRVNIMEQLAQAQRDEEESRARMLRVMQEKRSALLEEQSASASSSSFSIGSLRGTSTLRDAIILSEILGKPVAERGDVSTREL